MLVVESYEVTYLLEGTMFKMTEMLRLGKEAKLFDSRLYLAKSVLAIGTGFLIGRQMPIAHLDMISVLLGVMYNLEPLNQLGVKSGINQLLASILGASITGILVFLFGVNVLTVSIAMGLTLYIALKINWRFISPVAIFTSIYMTQYIQLNAAGEISMLQTFKLRIAALVLGILIAIFYNYIFSLFYYRKFAQKRLQFANLQMIKGLEYTLNQIRCSGYFKARQYIEVLGHNFNDLDLVYSNIEMLRDEYHMMRPHRSLRQLESLITIAKLYRDLNHLIYDLNFVLQEESLQMDSQLQLLLEEVMVVLKSIDYTRDIKPPVHKLKVENHYLKEQQLYTYRMELLCGKVNQIVEVVHSL